MAENHGNKNPSDGNVSKEKIIVKLVEDEKILVKLVEDFKESCTVDEGGGPSREESQEIDEKIGDSDDIDAKALEARDAELTESQKEELRHKSQMFRSEGNKLFNKGDYEKSVACYTEGLKTCPLMYTEERSIFFSNRAASKSKLGLTKEAIQDCSKAIDLNSKYLKAYMRRAKLYEEDEKLEEALEDYKKIIEYDPSNNEAIFTASALSERIKQKNEKLKAEMIDKLKDIGNVILRPFGLSTSNFQVTQDPDTGSYSVNFAQNGN